MRATLLPPVLVFSCGLLACSLRPAAVEPPELHTELDRRVWTFLVEQDRRWDGENVPAVDGRLLFDLIEQGGYTRALEVGTSTGRSAVWMAWALSRTGGRLITIEIDPERHRTAVENLRRAGLEHLVDARLGDAHLLVHRLEGPFDFVFCDADKDWNRNYLDALLPRMVAGGCFTTHNVAGWFHASSREFQEHLATHPRLETRFDRTSAAGLSISVVRDGDPTPG